VIAFSEALRGIVWEHSDGMESIHVYKVAKNNVDSRLSNTIDMKPKSSCFPLASAQVCASRKILRFQDLHCELGVDLERPGAKQSILVKQTRQTTSFQHTQDWRKESWSVQARLWTLEG
jgi:hypothetical protein